MTLRRVAYVITGIAATLVLAVPASADAAGGAEVIRTNQCLEEPTGVFCIDSLLILHEVRASDSGNMTVHVAERFDYTFTGAGELEGCHQEGNRSAVSQILFVDDEVQVNTLVGRGHDIVVECEGTTYDCRYKEEFTESGGEWRHGTFRSRVRGSRITRLKVHTVTKRRWDHRLLTGVTASEASGRARWLCRATLKQ